MEHEAPYRGNQSVIQLVEIGRRHNYAGIESTF